MREELKEWSSNGTTNKTEQHPLQSNQETTNILISKNNIKEIVREILAEMFGVQNQNQIKQWYDIAEAYKLLDLKSAKQLREMIRSGLLRVGYEVRDRRSPDSQIARYQVHIQKTMERLQKPPEKRR